MRIILIGEVLGYVGERERERERGAEKGEGTGESKGKRRGGKKDIYRVRHVFEDTHICVCYFAGSYLSFVFFSDQ